MSDTAIRVEHLSKQYRFGGQQVPYKTLRESLTASVKSPLHWLKGGQQRKNTFWALDDISFEIKQGEAVGIIGRNGAGKSTLLKILSRITKPTRGRVEIFGRVGSLLEVGTGFHHELTGRENIYLNGAILGMKRSEIERKFDEIVDFAEIDKFLDTQVKFYSSGMYMRLAFAVAAHLEPETLIVDEVLAVGDVNFRKKCMQKMDDVTHRHGRTILFVSHDMNAVRQLCPRTIWLDKASIFKSGHTDIVTREYEQGQLPETTEDSGKFIREPVPNKPFYIEMIELRNTNGELSTQYQYGNEMEIRIHFHGQAPQDGFTVEWLLFNESGSRISFGAANPVQQVYFNRSDKIVICKLRHLPLTTGRYSFYFSSRIWGLERWDEWEHAASFQIIECDPYKTGHSIPGGPNGDFIIDHIWVK